MDPKMANVSSIPKQLAWSRAVCSKLQRENPISVEGPFGGISFDPRDVQTVICLVGGSGLTVGLSVSQYVDSADTVKENHKSVDMGAERIATTVAMLWSVNTTEDPIKLSSVFSDLSERTTVSVHRTTNNTEVECGIVLAAARGVDTTRGRETGTAVVTVVDGRVNFIDYLSQYSNAGDVGIVICGPPSFTTYALIASESFAQQRKDKVLLSVESFCL